MTNAGPVGHGKPPKVFSPLWVISLFLGVSEVAVTVATTQATGWIQSMLAIFAVAFPFLVSLAFFLTLWNNNKVLYAPGEFTSDTTVQDYVEAMNRNNRRSVSIVEAALQSALTRLETQLEVLGATAHQRGEILASVSTAARAVMITVNVSVFNTERTEPPVVEVPVDESTTVTELLDAVYFAIWGKVEGFSYGKTWLLRDEFTGRRFDKIGTLYARRYLKTDRDYRQLSEVDIEPASPLAVFKLAKDPGA